MVRITRLILQATGLLTILALITGIIAFPVLGRWLQYQNGPEKADIIVPLGGDLHRLITAAELYKEGFAPKILLGNQRARPPSPLIPILVEMGYRYPQIEPLEFQIRVLEHLGVPRSAIESFGKELDSTAEEAEALKRLLDNQSATVLLVTSSYQARRAKIIFERRMPHYQLLIVWAQEERLPRQWWSDKDSAVTTVTEIAKLLHYFAGGVFQRPTSMPTK